MRLSEMFKNRQQRQTDEIHACFTGRVMILGSLLVCLLFAGSAMVSGCGDINDTGNQKAPDAPVTRVLEEESHPGWGISECLLCHPTFTIHQSTSNPNVDPEEIQALVDDQGPSSCTFCHGSNGA